MRVAQLLLPAVVQSIFFSYGFAGFGLLGGKWPRAYFEVPFHTLRWRHV